MVVTIPPVEYHRAARHQLLQKIEVLHIAREDRRADLAGLQVDQAVVEQPALLSLIGRDVPEPQRLAGEHAGFAPEVGVRREQAVPRDVVDRTAQRRQRLPGPGVRGFQLPEGMRQLPQADRGMEDAAVAQEIVDRRRCSALERIEIDRGVDEKGQASLRFGPPPIAAPPPDEP